MNRLFLHHIFLLCLSIAYGKDSVPVLIWDTQKAPSNLPAVSALQIVPYATFQKKYLDFFQPENIILFLQDSLSVEDISSHAGELRHVSSLMEGSHSLYLPSVEDPSFLAHDLPAHDYNVVTLEPGTAVSELKLKKGSKNLVIVKLPSTVTNPSRKKALQKTDEIIENVVSKIGKMANFTIIFTGKEPAMKIGSSNVEHRRVTRAASTRIQGFYPTNCVLLYLRENITLIKGNSSVLELPEGNVVGNFSNCGEDIAFIQINYANVNDIPKVQISFNFYKKSRTWTLQNAQVFVQDTANKKVTLLPGWPMDNVPYGKSYTCSQQLTLRSNETFDDQYNRMIIKGMQVEVFETSKEGTTRFDGGWDCVGFFTIPIWMGLFAGILLTLILAIGMYMLSQVKTMDRFDDPKAKHFMIAGSSE